MLPGKAVDFAQVARLRLLPFAIVAGLLLAPSAFACGTAGYSYAGISAPARAYGIGATVTPLAAFDVRSGHVAGWVGVGGPRQGPGGADEWLQVGLSGFAGVASSSIYYEVTRPNAQPTYHQVATDVPLGRAVRLAVLEMHKRPNFWRVWVNGAPASEPIALPGSHGRWSPIATAESWDGNTGGKCNGFLYRFHRVAIARAPGGGWAPLAGGYAISSPVTKMQRSRTTASFLAAQGDVAFRTLASFSP